MLGAVESANTSSGSVLKKTRSEPRRHYKTFRDISLPKNFRCELSFLCVERAKCQTGAFGNMERAMRSAMQIGV